MKYITFQVSGKPKHVFLSHIGFIEEAPGEPTRTRIYVQGVPLIVPLPPDAVMAQILEETGGFYHASAEPPKSKKPRKPNEG